MKALCRELSNRPGTMAMLIARSKTLRVEVEDFYMEPANLGQLFSNTEVAKVLTTVFDVPLATALTMKDMAMQSDTDYQVFYSCKSARDCVQMPRFYLVKEQRVALNKTVKRLVGLKVLLDDLRHQSRESCWT